MLSVDLEQVVLQCFEDLDTPFSLKCAILARYEGLGAVARLDCRPQDYDTPERYFRSAQALALVKKLRGLPSAPSEQERRAATIEKWWAGEVSCYKANQRLYPYLPGVNHLERDERITPHFAEIRRIIAEELIGFKPPDLLEGRHGPGATFGDRGRETTVPHKMSSVPTLTSECVWFLPQFFGTAWGRYIASERSLSFVRGNRFTTVPKTSLVDRPIAVEPSINVFFQLAIGTALRQRLKRRVGWDLGEAQAIHRRVARESSVSREFATLDLSNASDTVAFNLVRLLLPHAWFSVMSDLRSPTTTHPDDPTKVVWLEKFSSMGNGFTFELETVIFSALAIHASRLMGHKGVLGWDVFVYGDDIIVRNDVVNVLRSLLNFCGFTLNDQKSFFGESPFRESCGADFYNGVDVRPSYLKEDPRDIQGCIGVANRLRAAYDRLRLMGGDVVRSAWFRAVQCVPLPYRSCRGPRALGDSVIWDDEQHWRVRWRHSIRYIRALKPGDKVIVPYSRFPPDVVLACATYGAGNVGTPEGGRVPSREGVNPRDCIRSYVVGWLAHS